MTLAENRKNEKNELRFTPIGIVIATTDGNSPSVNHFAFLSTPFSPSFSPLVKRGQYCLVDTFQGQIIGLVEEIHIMNNYFHDFQTVKNFTMANLQVNHFLPSDEWEIQIAEVQVLGYIHTNKKIETISSPEEFKMIESSGFPVKPGNQVYLLQGEFLHYFLGFKTNGLQIGTLNHYSTSVSLDLNRLFNKHVAILAQSGAGKSYLVSVMLEELLMRPSSVGTPGMILIDLHGEYRFLKQKIELNTIDKDKIGEIQSKIQIINASFMQIGISDMLPYDFQRYQPNITYPQLRELQQILENLDQNQTRVDLNELFKQIEKQTEINSKTQSTLIAWLEDLARLNIFTQTTKPCITDLIHPGKLTILDFSTILSMRKKQIFVDFFTKQLFYFRRKRQIAPFILFLEEAHNFLPETDSKSAFAKHILETLAREGRKFFAQLVLISQRPVRLSTTALSQCNTHIIMRITNPYDLNHIKNSSEALTSDSIKIISSLPTGSAVILGGATNYPVFFKVRRLLLTPYRKEISLESESQSFMPLIHK
ncbi:MAG: ATP-binding protein [Promethearchaeota archaeon]